VKWLGDGLLGVFVAVIAARVAWSETFEGLAVILLLLTLIATVRRFPIAGPNAGLGFLLLVMGGLGGYFLFEELVEPGTWVAYFRVAAGMILGATFHLVWWFVARPLTTQGLPDRQQINMVLLGTALLLLTPEPAGAPAIMMGGSRLPVSLLLAFTALFLSQLGCWHRSWPWRRLLWLLPTLLLTVGLVQGLKLAQRPILGALYAMMPDFDTPSSGFSPFQSLPSNAFLMPSEKVVLRLQGEALPSAYLVGSRHHYFDGKKFSWSSPEGVRPGLVEGGDGIFRLDFGVQSSVSGVALQIESLRDDSYLFLPPNSRRIEAVMSGLSQPESGVLDGRWGEDVRHLVRVMTGPGRPQSVASEYLQLPEWWDSALDEYAARFSGPTRAGQASAVARAFYSRDYSLEVKLDRKRPFHDFVLNEKPGFCFWYASAGALLLRAQGVPTRLVSGYRVWEPLASDAWVVRERDAHSWVEWQDEAGFWQLLDPTPPSLGGFLAQYRSSAFNRYWHLWRLRVRNWWDALEFDERFEQAVIGTGFFVLLVLFVREYRRIISRAGGGQLQRWGRLWQKFVAATGLPEQPAVTAGQLSGQFPESWPEEKARLSQRFLTLYQRHRFAAPGAIPSMEIEQLVKRLQRLRLD